MLKWIFLMLGVALSQPLSAFDGDVITKTSMGGQSTQQTYVAKGDRMKFDLPEQNVTILFDAARQQRITLDHAAKKYYVEALDANNVQAPDGEIEDTGETGEILGYTTRKLIFREKNGGRYEIWATAGIKNNALTSMPGMTPEMKADIMEIFGSKYVFPMKLIVFKPNGKESMRMEVIGVHERRVSDIELTLPSSYDDQYLVPKE